MGQDNSRQLRLDSIKRDACQKYRQTWQSMINAWQKDNPEDVGWLMYSANYLFRTGNIRWAIDPLLLNNRVSAPALDHAAADLEKLDFILLTHNHADHFDRSLIQTLKDLPIRWVVPLDMQESVMQLGIKETAVISAEPGKQTNLYGIQIMPFEGIHFHTEADGLQYGVPESGYLVDTADKRLLFPGDTREYRSDFLPKFTDIDLAFAHLWLGKGNADLESPPLVEEFSNFFCDLQPSRLVVTHLYEFKRSTSDMWDERHFHLVQCRLKEILPGMDVDMKLMGESINI